MGRPTSDAASAYRKLKRQTIPSDQLAVDETEIATPFGNVAYGTTPKHTPLLLIPVDKRLDSSTLEWSNQSISFDYRSITRSGTAQAYLVLECINPRLSSTFNLLIDDILEAIAESPAQADAATKATIERWRALLRDQRRPFLSEEALVGLLGELTFLEELTASIGPNALATWVGPMSGRHDFVSSTIDVEIKSTTARDGFPITVHGAAQLMPAPGTSLHVRAYRFDPHPTGDSIPSILDRLYRLGVDRLDLLRIIELVGYSEVDSKHYAGRTYALLESKTCCVDGDFPRLTAETVSKDLLDKIRSLNYVLDLTALSSSSITLDAFMTTESEASA